MALQKLPPIDQLKEGQILDGRDYLDAWHLSVICKIQPDNESEFIKLNFLPYPKGNRDEWIGKNDVERLAGVFTHSEQINDKEQLIKSIQGLRDYSNKLKKKGQDVQASSSKDKNLKKQNLEKKSTTPVASKKEEKKSSSTSQ